MEAAEIIRKATRRTVKVPLFLAGELVEQYEALERQHRDATRKGGGGDTLNGGPALAVAQQMEELRAEMAEYLVTVVLRPLPRRGYRQLLAAHPPRRDEDGEALPADLSGFNADTFYPTLIRACWDAPTLDPADVDHLLDEVVTDVQFERLCIGAMNANRGEVDLNFLLDSSTTPQDSEPQ